ncbi:DUF4267 domain-containing protein [Chitinophaga varians]|uniref:DUF4267 domain-containing protein n=1 Tax=Chitinophaga varians TaxID=2202339 RepID=A0A847RTW9_9BACT|nr:DUF4267 domain-containing protein [Chitinophaga varians]NLR64315.1 DUF4267 domain-containing protein [Chitinophaga varians]
MKQLSYYLTLLTGLLLIFIGARFLLVPMTAETAFGIHTSTGGDYSFHYIKGVRDLFTGVAIVLLLLMREFRAAGFLLLAGSIIPMVDFSVVMSHPDYVTARLYPHAIAVVLSLILGFYYIRTTAKS